MPDTITRTTSTSWFSRIGGAFTGVLIGFILIIACIGGLFWNEGRAIKTEKGLTEGAAVVIEIQPGEVVAANDQKLVHVSGPAVVTAPLEDTDFGVTATGLHLARKVEMYQWKEASKSESRTRLGGGEETVTTYTYTKEWASSANDSSQFAEPNGHQNPEFDIQAADILAQDATLGAFKLEDNVVGQVGGETALRLTPADLETVDAAVGDIGRYVSISQNRIMLTERRPTVVAPSATSDDEEAATDETVTDETNDDATNETTVPTQTVTPAASIGDVRVSYDLTPAGPISVVARQNGEGFLPYYAKNGEEFLLVDNGDKPASDMFKGAQDANQIMTWIIRVVGLVLLIAGFGLLMAPLGVLADVLPLAGTIVRMGTGLIAFALGMLIGTVTIALAWIVFRPLIGIAILVVGGGIAFSAYRLARGKGKKAEAAA
ncbi:MAG TPA: TMEM43 family protein [Brevundimonas sp.]|jgi:hypothetical protein